MSRFVLALLAVFALMGVFVAGLDVLTIEGREGATVLKQLVATTRFGFAVLAFILSLGVFALLGAVERGHDRVDDQLKALKQIAEATAAMRDVVEAPIKKAEAGLVDKATAEKRARYAAFREELARGSQPAGPDASAAGSS